MKKIKLSFTIIFVLLIQNVYTQNISPHFNELRGIEDNAGETILFYRIYKYNIDSNHNYYYTDNISRINIISGEDSIFLYSGGSGNMFSHFGSNVSSFDLWNNDFYTYIECGVVIGMDPTAYIRRFDDEEGYNYGLSSFENVAISKQNDSLVYSGGRFGIIKSTD